MEAAPAGAPLRRPSIRAMNPMSSGIPLLRDDDFTRRRGDGRLGPPVSLRRCGSLDLSDRAHVQREVRAGHDGGSPTRKTRQTTLRKRLTRARRRASPMPRVGNGATFRPIHDVKDRALKDRNKQRTCQEPNLRVAPRSHPTRQSLCILRELRQCLCVPGNGRERNRSVDGTPSKTLSSSHSRRGSQSGRWRRRSIRA